MPGESPEVDVIYEDNHLIAVNKPAGIMTQPSGTPADNIEDRTKEYIKRTRNKKGRVFLHAVHRLDKVASGIALFACTDKALSRMNELMRGHGINRVYHAVITGELPGPQGNLVHFLRHSHMQALSVGEDDPGAKRSKLQYRVLGRTGRFILVEITLETGRYHQIRAQLAASGCPIIGDKLYGSSESFQDYGIALHHRKMEFVHPVTKLAVTFEAAYPPLWPLRF
jgi:23S rRNA pseudouridine1911/1915/1917 synthase